MTHHVIAYSDAKSAIALFVIKLERVIHEKVVLTSKGFLLWKIASSSYHGN